MANKKVIAVRGPGKCGKTTTIRMAHELLCRLHPGALENSLIIGANDLLVILTIDSTKVGIASKGDPNTLLATRLKRLRELDCSIIVCATRTSGPTVKAVEKTKEHGYDLVWLPKVKRKPPEWDLADREMVAKIVVEVELALKKDSK